MEENYCQRMKHFVLRDHIFSHLLLSQSRSSVLLSRGAYKAVIHLPESGSLEPFSVLGGNTAQQKAEGDQGPGQTSCTPALQGSEQSQAKLHLTPKAAAASGAEHRHSETPWFRHYCKGLSLTFQKHMWGYCSLSVLCSRPCW